MARTLITNGLVVSPSGSSPMDVLIDGETIAALYAPGQVEAQGVTADRTLDATGKYVIPGGIDVHTHMELPFGGTNASDTFETGTRAAAWGGVTTIVDFAVQSAGGNVMDGLAAWHEKAAGECAVDYAFHQIVGGIDEESLKAMRYLTEHEGITSFKLFQPVNVAGDGVLFDNLTFNVAAPGGMIGASNFFELSVAVAISLFGASSPVVLATIVGVLVEVPVMLSLVKIANRTPHWFPATRQF